jgi:paired amphipathic helix protein Sin3a
VLRFTSTFDPLRPSVAVEEVELFEQIKKYIGNRPSYEEFLKTLNLYTQHIIDIDLLVSLVKAFLGTNKELFDAFKMAISYEPKEHPIVRPTLFTAKPDLAHCTAVDSSPSYRVVPKDVSYYTLNNNRSTHYGSYSGRINLVLVEINCAGKY